MTGVDRVKNTKMYVEENFAFTVPCLVVTCTRQVSTLTDPGSSDNRYTVKLNQLKREHVCSLNFGSGSARVFSVQHMVLIGY